MKNNKYQISILLTMISLLLLLSNNLFLYKIFAVGLSFIVIRTFISKITQEFAVFEVIFFVTVLQLFILPMMDKNLSNLQEYLLIMGGGILSFYYACNLGRKRIIFKKNSIVLFIGNRKNFLLLKGIMLLGICFKILTTYKSFSFDLILNLITSVGYVFSIVLLYKEKKKYLIYPIIYFLLFLNVAIRTTVFAEFILSGMLLFVFIPTLFNLNKKQVLLVLIFGFFVISFLNTVKTAYRSLVWVGDSRGFSLELFIDSVFENERENDGYSFSERASAGSTIAQIYDYVPDHYPHTFGTQFLSDFTNSIVPRVLFPSKKDIDTHTNYTRYTGNLLPEDVSVGINPFGIAYAEFGVFGSWVFMFLFGRALCLLNNYLYKMISEQGNTLVLILYPLFYISFIKMEEEFVGQLNGWIKGMLFLLSFVYMYKIYKFKLNIKNA
ncbi:hypothetical protein SLW70_00555 [Flavobacterium sp. NG2]|uniref:hypothetical protein n=1 Tax=Flavobacterium sp. NG2 TaxID=3097547 RepID=UPI002A825CAB|nr:hypothetical protein [Flavobacterium sp. NG2]WPR71649.1 hypothetical protein SLW70_00555 [Flavobacterium sp. NG2]